MVHQDTLVQRISRIIAINLSPLRAAVLFLVLFIVIVVTGFLEDNLVIGKFWIEPAQSDDRGLFEDWIFLSLFVYPLILLAFRKYLIHPLFAEFTKYQRFARATDPQDGIRIRELIYKSKSRFRSLKNLRFDNIFQDRMMRWIYVSYLVFAIGYFAISVFNHLEPEYVYGFDIWSSPTYVFSMVLREIFDFLIYVLILPYVALEGIVLIIEFCNFYTRVSRFSYIDFLYIVHYERRNIELPGRIFASLLATSLVLSIPIMAYYLTYPNTMLLKIGTGVFTAGVFGISALPVFYIFNLLHRARHTTAIEILKSYGVAYMPAAAPTRETTTYSGLLSDIAVLNSLKVHPISRGLLIVLVGLSGAFVAASNGLVNKALEHVMGAIGVL